MIAMHLFVSESTAPHYPNLLEFLTHGISYVFSPKKGGLTRGIPTAHAAPRGVSCAIKQGLELYKLLALNGAIRIGRSREKQLAIQSLTERLSENRGVINAS